MSQHSSSRPAWLLGGSILLVGASNVLAPAASAHETFVDCPECPRMVMIPGGRFTMGSPRTQGEPPRRKYEGPQSDVRIASFAIGETEVTRRQYAAFVADTHRAADGGCFTYGFSSLTDDSVSDSQASWRNPGFEQTDDHPVMCISWQDASDYATWLTRKTGQTYRLPSEAEWEYAARAGTTSTFFWGEDEERACTYANGGDPSVLRRLPALREVMDRIVRDGDPTARYVECNDGNAFTAAVGRYEPNAFGLYDMIGNAWEFVADCWSPSLPTSELALSAPSCDRYRVRGGSWNDYPEELRSARRSAVQRDKRRNDDGFRVARTLSAAEAERVHKQ